MTVSVDLRHVRNGIVTAIGIVAGIVLVGALLYGIGQLRDRITNGTVIGGKLSSLSINIFITAAALAVLAATMSRWVKLLPGLFGYATLGSVIAILNGGWYPRNPALHLSRAQVSFESLMLLLACVLTIRFQKHTPTMADRIGVIGVLIGMALSFTAPNARGELRAMTAVVSLLAVLQLIELLRSNKA